jgi:hypothetical protein
MDCIIAYVLSNFSLTTFLLALIIAFALVLVRRGTLTDAGRYDIFLRYFFLLPCGIAGVYGFVLHGFFPNLTAESIGWAPSPFQWEVAVANLGFGLVCIFATWAGCEFRLAGLVGISVWFWGDAAGHIFQMIVNQDYAPGNAGSWFWTDVLIPAFMIVFYSLWRRALRAS